MVYIRQSAAGYNTPTVSIHPLPHPRSASKVAKFTINVDERKQTLFSIKVAPTHSPFRAFCEQNASAKILNYSVTDAFFSDYFCIFAEKEAKRINSEQIMTTYLRFFNYNEAFGYYCNLITKMRQGSNGKGKSRIIAKPALMLSIIKLIEEGKTVNKFSYDELEATYKGIFGKYFVETHQKNLTPLCYPYYYLKSDQFWHLVWTNAETKTEAPSAAWIRKNTKYAYIDKELWILLSNASYRKKMVEFILEEKIQKAFLGNGSKNIIKTLLHLLMVV